MREGDRVQRYAARIKKAVKDILFPVFCFGCSKEGMVICPACLDAIETRGVSECPVCHAQTPLGACCAHCLGASHLDAHVAITTYRQDDLVGKLVHAYKYQYVTEVADAFRSLISRWQGDHREYIEQADCIIPVPLAARRQAERGFNQSARIAEILAAYADRPTTRHLLARMRDTGHQARLSREGRLANVRGAFATNASIADVQTALIVDDVFTTGATMQACAEVLKNAGVRRVVGFSIGRGILVRKG